MAQFNTWTGRTLGEPTAEQWECLKAYAAEHGRAWKHQLLQEWQTGRDTGLLRQVRNQFGPRWLLLVDIKGER